MTTTKKPASKPVVAKPATANPVSAKAIATKPADTVVETAKPAPVAAAPVAPAPVPAAPVAAKTVETPAAPKPVAAPAPVAKAAPKPVATTKPVVAPAPAAKAEPKSAPKSAPKAKAPEFLDAMKPFAVLQEQIRKQAEQNAEQVRASYAVLKDNAELATAKLEESIVAARTGAKVFGEKVLDAVRMQAQVGLDHAKALGAAKDLGEVAKLQQAFVLKQIEALKAQTEEFAAFSTKVANDVSEPAKASIAAAFKR